MMTETDWEKLSETLNGIRNYMKENEITHEEAVELMNYDGLYLRELPDEMKNDKDLCIAAVLNNPYSTGYMDDVSLEVWQAALDREVEIETEENGFNYGFFESWVEHSIGSREEVPYDILKQVCKIDGMAIEHLRDEWITDELCDIALESDSVALQVLPYNFRTPERCEYAVSKNGTALYDVPEEHKTYDMCLSAVSNSPKHSTPVECVPMEFRTYELCLKAVQISGLSLHYVPRELRDEQMCVDAVKANPESLAFVPKEYQTEELILYATKTDSSISRFIKGENADPSMSNELEGPYYNECPDYLDFNHYDPTAVNAEETYYDCGAETYEQEEQDWGDR